MCSIKLKRSYNIKLSSTVNVHPIKKDVNDVSNILNLGISFNFLKFIMMKIKTPIPINRVISSLSSINI